VAADAPENGFPLFARPVDGNEELAEVLSGEDVGKRIEKL